MNLSDLGEFGFIERMRSWLPPTTASTGVGDDAAVVGVGQGKSLVATADALVEGVHFRSDWSTGADIGFKAVSVNVSDLAAMGAEPRWLLVTLCAPPSLDAETAEALYAGFVESSAVYGAEVVGGDTVRSSELVLAVTALGEIEGAPLLRSGARVGDVLAVTGTLGRAAAGVNLLLSQDPKDVNPDDALACIDAHRRPVARVAEGQKLRQGGVHAAIDISDGLASDATRMCEASGVGVEIDTALLPVAPPARRVSESRGWDVEKMVLSGGEDLELLVSVPAGIDPADLDLIEIGRVVDEGVWLVRDGERTPLEAMGYDHFALRP